MPAPKILFTGSSDWSNTRNRIARAINDLEDSAVARVCVKQRNTFDYGEDIVMNAGDPAVALGKLIWLTRKMNENDWLCSTGEGPSPLYHKIWRRYLPGVKRASCHSGSPYRDAPGYYDAADKKLGVRVRFLAADLYRFAADDPTAVPMIWSHDMARVLDPAPVDGPVVISHSPSKRCNKGTENILPVLEALRGPGVEIDLIENVPFETCLSRRARSHIFVDQLKPYVGAYAGAAVEAMAQGCAVVSDIRHVTEEVEAFYKRPPIVHVDDANDLFSTLTRLIDDRILLQEQRYLSVHWARTTGSPAEVAKYWLSHFERF